MSKENILYAKDCLRKISDELDVPKRKRKEIFEALEERNPFLSLRNLLPAFYENPSSIFDYFDQDIFVIELNSFDIRQKALGFEREEFENYERLITEEKIVLHPNRTTINPEILAEKLGATTSMYVDDFYIENKNSQKFELETKILNPIRLEMGHLKMSPLKHSFPC